MLRTTLVRSILCFKSYFGGRVFRKRLSNDDMSLSNSSEWIFFGERTHKIL